MLVVWCSNAAWINLSRSGFRRFELNAWKLCTPHSPYGSWSHFLAKMPLHKFAWCRNLTCAMNSRSQSHCRTFFSGGIRRSCFVFLPVTERNVFEMTEIKLSHFGQIVWKNRLKNTFTASVNTTALTNDRNVSVTNKTERRSILVFLTSSAAAIHLELLLHNRVRCQARIQVLGGKKQNFLGTIKFRGTKNFWEGTDPECSPWLRACAQWGGLWRRRDAGYAHSCHQTVQLKFLRGK